MTDWTKKWDKREKNYDRRNGQPVFPIKLLIIVGIVLFFFMIGFATIFSVSHVPNCEGFIVEYNTPVECNDYIDSTAKVKIK